MNSNSIKSKFKSTYKSVIVSVLAIVASLASHSNVLAVTISTKKPSNWTRIGDIRTFEDLIFFIINALRYFGWIGVILGVSLALFSLIYKLFSEDNDKVMKTVQGTLTKSIVIVIAGILLISSGFIINLVSEIFGVDLGVDLSGV